MSKNKDILIVDDDPVYLKVIADFIRKKFPNFNVLKTSSSKDALKIFKKRVKSNPIEFSIIDWKMPEITGEFLSVMFKEECPSIKTVLLTGSSDHIFLKHFSAYKFDLILSKKEELDCIFDKLNLILK